MEREERIKSLFRFPTLKKNILDRIFWNVEHKGCLARRDPGQISLVKRRGAELFDASFFLLISEKKSYDTSSPSSLSWPRELLCSPEFFCLTFLSSWQGCKMIHLPKTRGRHQSDGDDEEICLKKIALWFIFWMWLTCASPTFFDRFG